MNMKNIILSTTLVAVLGASGITLAEPYKKQCSDTKLSRVHHNHIPGMGSLSKEQKIEFQNSMKALHKSMAPLIKKKMALQMQLRGKFATPEMTWEETAKIVSEINANNAKITTLFAKNQLNIFQKYGVMLPKPHEKNKFFHGKSLLEHK